jgi:hypothetical protein
MFCGQTLANLASDEGGSILLNRDLLSAAGRERLVNAEKAIRNRALEDEVPVNEDTILKEAQVDAGESIICHKCYEIYNICLDATAKHGGELDTAGGGNDESESDNNEANPVWKKEIKWTEMENYSREDLTAKNYCNKANIDEMDKKEWPMVLMAMCIGVTQIEGEGNETPGM